MIVFFLIIERNDAVAITFGNFDSKSCSGFNIFKMACTCSAAGDWLFCCNGNTYNRGIC